MLIETTKSEQYVLWNLKKQPKLEHFFKIEILMNQIVNWLICQFFVDNIYVWLDVIMHLLMFLKKSKIWMVIDIFILIPSMAQ